MTLLELLVKELPQRGGWPEGCSYAMQDIDKEVKFINFGFDFSFGRNNQGFWGAGTTDAWEVNSFFEGKLCSDFATSIITRDQYEAALAASQQPVWDGEGLPPVGVECEFFNDDYDCRPSVPANGTVVKIVSHQKSNKGMDLAVFTWPGERSGLHAEVCTEMLFRPLRTEAERKREAFATSLCEHLDDLNDWDSPVAQVHALAIYDAIAAGKIPGVKLIDEGE